MFAWPARSLTSVGDGTPVVASFRVEAGGTTACTIVNTLAKNDPKQVTSQTGTASIMDSISLTGIKAGATDARNAMATFRLYSGNPCSDPVGGVGGNLVYTSDPITLTYGNNGTTAFAGMAVFQTIVPGITYYWRVSYSGDAYNNGVRTACGSETANVTFTFFQ